jgi:hypothetical protein
MLDRVIILTTSDERNPIFWKSRVFVSSITSTDPFQTASKMPHPNQPMIRFRVGKCDAPSLSTVQSSNSTSTRFSYFQILFQNGVFGSALGGIFGNSILLLISRMLQPVRLAKVLASFSNLGRKVC